MLPLRTLVLRLLFVAGNVRAFDLHEHAFVRGVVVRLDGQVVELRESLREKPARAD